MTIRRTIAFVLDHSLLLIAGAAGGLMWANLWPASYTQMSHRLHFAVNDIGMMFFFALAAKEVVEATLPGGPLASPRQAAVPLLAAVGGMMAPALLHVTLAMAAQEPALTRGWAIPCATDIAFSYLVARLIFGSRHPAIPFLLLLAIADDAMGLAILAVFYPTGEVRLIEFTGLLALALAVAWWLQRKRVMSFWPYVLAAGSVSWAAFLRGGLHPALALVPIVPFVPHASRDLGILAESEMKQSDPLSRFERWWHVPVQLILFFFGLVNAGVALSNAGTGTWVVLTALIVGKPVGILLSTAGAVALGGRRPRGVTWRDMLVVGIAAAIGFTVSLFFATAAFTDARLLDETKMGALLSFSAAAIAVGMARVLRVGRFGSPQLDR